MIISASRRTDIPSFYSDWFFNRLQKGFVLVRNPMNMHQVSRVSLEKEVVDCIVFWSKNPGPMLPKLNLIKDYNYYFQFTLNPYDFVFENRVPKKSILIDTFKRLSNEIGPQRVIWRYDPILISDVIDMDYHEKYFGVLAEKLKGYTSKCVISFIDYYKKLDKSFKEQGIKELTDEKKEEIARKFVCIAKSYNLKIETCAENIDLIDIGVGHAKCVDPDLIGSMLGNSINCKKDRNQRKYCGCIESVDIGAYNTCAHGCIYCYANYSRKSVKKNIENYDKDSPLLCSMLTEEDRIYNRENKSLLL